MVVRALFVGLGGTGGVALACARSQLIAQLRQAGWRGAFPANVWRFVHIDVPVEPDINDRLVRAERGSAMAAGLRQFQGSQYASLLDRSETYTVIDGQAKRAAGRHGEILRGWRPSNPRFVRTPINLGAGQYRGTGALVALARRDRVVEILRSAANDLNGQQALTEATEIADRLRNQGVDNTDDAISAGDRFSESTIPPLPQVFIVSSMVGGAGSGLFLEVSSVARSLFGQPVSAFLVAPEAFDLHQIGRYAPSNAWALMSEIQHLAAADSEEAIHNLASDRFPPPGQAQGDGTKPSTAATIFVAGKSNSSGVNLTGDAAVEQVVGEMLAAAVTSDAVFKNMLQYAVANAPFAAVDELGLGPSGLFRAVGFARLELGRARFAQYAADRLLVSVARRLLGDDLDVEEQEEFGSQAALVDHIAERSRYEFATKAGLCEYDATGHRGQISTRLHVEPLDKWNAADANAYGGADRLTLGEFFNRMRNWTKERRAEAPTWQKDLRSRIDLWQADVEEALLQATWESVADYGLPLTSRLLEHLANDLRAAADQLLKDAEALKESGRVVQMPGQEDRAVSQAQRDQVAHSAATNLTTEFEAKEWQETAHVCRQVASLLVRPLRDQIEQLIESMREADSGWQVLLRERAERGEESYRARPHEVVIEPIMGPGGFAERFVEQMRIVTEAAGPDAAERQAVSEILTSGQPVLIDLRRSWNSGHGKDAVATSLRTAVDSSVPVMVSVVDSWMRRPDKPLHHYLSAGLRHYVEGGRDNIRTFGQKLSLLLQFGAPLGKTNPHVRTIHELPSARWVLSELPFGLMPEVQGVIDEKINESEWAQYVGGRSYINEERDAITIMTDEGPYQAICFETLMSPVREVLTSSTKGDIRRHPSPRTPFHQVGLRRHAVPLGMTGPLSQVKVVDFLVGCILGQAAGLVSLKNGTVKDPLSPGRQLRLSEIPYPVDRQEARVFKTRLGQALDDLKVAYIRASQTDDLGPLRPYQIILQYGEDPVSVVAQMTDPQREVAREAAKTYGEMAEEARKGAVPESPSSDLEELADAFVSASNRVIDLLDELGGGFIDDAMVDPDWGTEAG